VVHGAPGTVQLRIAIASAELAIEIQDDGCAFNLGSATSGNGLVNMRSRIAEIGGHFDLTSAPGSGTTISIRLPLSALTK
jgi:signal transduction histidine kinase